MSKRWEVRLIGTGGQGIVTASIILAVSALREGNNVVQSQNYGPEVRGGYSTAYVIASESSILYPKIDRPNVLLVMTSTDYEKYLHEIDEDGMLILNGEPGPERMPDNVYFIPITNIAHDELERPITANIVCVGAVVGLTGMVSEAAALAAVEEHVPAKAVKINRRAFILGVRAAREALAQREASATS